MADTIPLYLNRDGTKAPREKWDLNLIIKEIGRLQEIDRKGDNEGDYTLEERLTKGRKVVKKIQDKIDLLHYYRLQAIGMYKHWHAFDVFKSNVILHGHRVATIWLDENGIEEQRWTFAQLLEKARVIAATLTKHYKLKPGDRVLLSYEPCLEFFPAFWACIGTGIIAVPVCPADPFAPSSDLTDKVLAIWKDSEPKLILTSRRYKDTLAAAASFLGSTFESAMATREDILDTTKRLWIATDSIKPDTPVAKGWVFPPTPLSTMSDAPIAFLQYTSGSTGGAKGVVVRHWELVANCFNCTLLTQGLGDFRIYQQGIGISWLPTFHDMGLIGFHVAPMLIGGPVIYMSPIHFIQNPIVWLKVMSRYPLVFSGAPPFALDLCVRRVTEEDKKEIDLSGVAALILGAEPIKPAFLEAFATVFKRCGFVSTAFLTCFGMAENVLHVAGKWSNKYGVRKLRVDSKALTNNLLKIYDDAIVDVKDETTTEGNKNNNNTSSSSSSSSSTTTSSSTPPTVKHKPYYTADPVKAKNTYEKALKSAYKDKDRQRIQQLIDEAKDGNEAGVADSQWIVSSGEMLHFSTPPVLETKDFPCETRRPHIWRKEIASQVIVVNSEGEEVEDGVIGEIWVCGSSKTAGYFDAKKVYYNYTNNPNNSSEVESKHTTDKGKDKSKQQEKDELDKSEVNRRNFKAKLKKAVKPETKDLITWAKANAKKVHDIFTVDLSITNNSNSSNRYDMTDHTPYPDSLLDTIDVWSANLDRPVFGFLMHSVTKEGEVEWLRTGDMGVIYDGELFITGRLKEMIIIRGQNFYAHDIEHAINVRGIKDFTGIPESSKKALSMIRPGAVVAHTLTITSDGSQNCPAKAAKVEGEHLAIIAELKDKDEIDEDSDGEAEEDWSKKGSRGEPKSTKSKGKGDGTDTGSKTPKNKVKARGAWKDMAIKYGPSVIDGLGDANEDAELELVEKITGVKQRKKNKGCWDRVKVLGQRAFINCLRYSYEGVVTINDWMNSGWEELTDIDDSDEEEEQHKSDDRQGGGKRRGSMHKDGKSQSHSKKKGNESDHDDDDSDKDEDESDSEDDKPKKRGKKEFRVTDKETARIKAQYTEAQLDTIVSAIKSIVTSKFMLAVTQVTLVAPRTIRKTSSGKKRRAHTAAAIQDMSLSHRIIRQSNSKALEQYYAASPRRQHWDAKIKQDQERQLQQQKQHQHSGQEEKGGKTFDGKDKEKRHGGTVGVSLDGKNKYDTDDIHCQAKSKTIKLGSGSQSSTSKTTKSNKSKGGYESDEEEGDDEVVTVTLKPPLPHPKAAKVQGKKDGNLKSKSGTTNTASTTETENKQGNADVGEWTAEKVDELVNKANAINFDQAKEMVMKIIVKELREQEEEYAKGSGDGDKEKEKEKDQEKGKAKAKGKGKDKEKEKIDDGERGAKSDGPYGDGGIEVKVKMPEPPSWSKKITVDYLREMSKRDTEEQQNTLNESGVDSVVAFRIAKSLGVAFNVPPNMIGPHVFSQDPTIDGMVRVMMRLAKVHAEKVKKDFYEEEAVILSDEEKAKEDEVKDKLLKRLKAGPGAGINGVKRTNNHPLPYVLGIGTAVPKNTAPQAELMEAMLPSLKLDPKGEERFRKLSLNSGIYNRYSALDSIDSLFWGKTGVNSGTDEIVDVRQEVYKRESVNLSIEAAADCLNDWIMNKPRKTDADRKRDREKRLAELRARIVREKLSAPGITAETIDVLWKRAKETLKEMDGSDLDVDPDRVSTEKEQKSTGKDGVKDLSYLSDAAQRKTGRRITHVVAVTCTGIIVPGLEFYIMQALGLPNTTQRLSIQFMGCFGTVSGLRCASALAAEDPNNRILVVCTELCTLHMQLNDKVDNLIATALFGDGSGSFIVGCEPTPNERPIFAIHSLTSLAIPNTIDQMAWEMSSTGLKIGLAKEIPGSIFQCIGDFVLDMLSIAPDPKNPLHMVSPLDCNCAIHPGGPMIVNTIQDVLSIPQVGDGHGGGEIDPSSPAAETWNILREYGNMSSATLVFVLDRIRDNKEKADRWTPTIAFGPGLSIEGALLRACFGERIKQQESQ